MPRTEQPPLALLNARLADGLPTTLRIEDEHIAAIGVPPRAGDLQVDLRGGSVLPGLINAHDHLQLNALPRLKRRERHGNVSEWIDDMGPRLRSDPLLLADAAVPRADRLLIGGLKNLLCGVTTVAHHDPFHETLSASWFPVRVVDRQGWAHSLGLEGEEAVRRSFVATPAAWPWIVHAAEGVDAVAGAEFERLETLGCIRPNTRLVHGLGLTAAQQQRLVQAGAAVIWCPGSNRHLFGQTLDIGFLFGHRQVALGNDSRISGESDLLAELRLAREVSGLDDAALIELVTDRAAELLELDDRGRIEAGALADLIVLPAGRELSDSRRADLRLVMLGGRPRVCAPDLAAAFGGHFQWAPVRLDGVDRCLVSDLAERLAVAAIGESGLTRIPETVESQP